MKKIVITLIALFSVLAFSQPIRADTEQIATMNLSGIWGNTQAVITRSNGKLHIKHTGTVRFFGTGAGIRSVYGLMELQVKKNADNGYVASRLNFSMVNESKENDIDIDQGENDTFTFILKVGAQSIGMDPMGIPLSPVTVNDQSKTPTIVGPPKKPQASPITVNYVDKTGRIIHDSQQITGNYGDNYDATSSAYKLDLKGYTLDQSKLPNNATGKMSSTEQTVTYVYKASWGNVPWVFDESTGILTFTGGGSLAVESESPWKRSDALKIDASKIKRIVFTQKVKAPSNSSQLFGQVGDSDDAKSKRLNNLEAIDNLNYLDTNDVTDMSSMFYNTSSVNILETSKFNTSNVTNFKAMFAGCNNLSKLDVKNFDISKATDLSYMFQNTSLESLDLSNFNMINAPNSYCMFIGSDKLKNLTLGKENKFSDTVYLSEIKKSDSYTGYWQNIGTGTTEYPKGNNVWTSKELTNKYDGTKDADTYVWQKVKQRVWGNVPWEFDESTGTVTFTGSGTLGEYTTSPWNREDDFQIKWSAIKKIVFTNVVNAPESSKYLFSSYEKSARLRNLLSIEGLDKVNTSNVKSMFWMFTDASALTELKGIENWDTKNVTDMNNMFGGMLNLSSLDVSNFSTEKVTDMSLMLNWTTKLERLTLGKNSIFNISVNLSPIPNTGDYTGNWVLEGSETNVNMGTSSQFTSTYDGSKPGTYVWEKKVKQLMFKKVPDTMSFEDSKISNQTIESKRKDKDWEMIVEDTRVDKNPWRVTAKLVEPFKNNSGESSAGNILLFRKDNQSDQWIKSTEETNVFDGTSTKGIDDYNVSWSQNAGPIIQVAPGTVKAGEYKGVIQWSLIDAPV